MDDVPNAVDVWDLIGKELDQVEPAGDTDDPPVVENVKLRLTAKVYTICD
jgi:hypothetical protein